MLTEQRLAVPGILLLVSVVVGGLFLTQDSKGLKDLVDQDPAIAISVEADEAKMNVLAQNLKAAVANHASVNAAWVDRLSSANLLMVVVSDWNHMVNLETVPGLADVAESSAKLAKHDHREVFILSQLDRPILVVVAYMVPEFDQWSFDCLATDFSMALSDISAASEEKLSACFDLAWEQVQ